MMAVVRIAGQQFKIQVGDTIYVPHLKVKAPEQVSFSEVLFLEKDGKIVAGKDVQSTVKATVIKDMVQGDKVIAFKMKRRKGFRKKIGHRTEYSQIKIDSIS
ncbi:MAG: 50S ribosomal protein L21 [Phycisphaerales bacterium]|nr:50S ribosomal protein L21 [Phycisphaerales bacterium]